MSDYERYGDYNDLEDEAPKSKNPILVTMRILTALVCVAVIGTLVIRLFLFSSYPKSVKNIYFNESLLEYYSDTDGDIGAKTQDLQYAYSDPTLGYFFCDYLILIEEIGQVQITARYNTSNLKYMSEQFGVELDAGAENLFSYRLCTNKSYDESDYDKNGILKEDAEPKSYYEVSDSVSDSRTQYRYAKLVFDGVDFSTDKGDGVYWMRLEVLLPNGERCASVVIYQNNDNFSEFEDYSLSKGELPS